MKKIIRLFSVVLSLCIIQQNVCAQNDNDNDNKNDKHKKYEFVKNKSYSKSYNISSSDKINLDNKFGDMEIHTWNKNEIKVDVTIKVSADNEDWAKSVLDDIAVEDSKSGGEVKFKTLLSQDLDKKEGGTKHQDKYKNKESHQTMEVNYSVYIPASNPIKIENEFGATILPDYQGEAQLTSKFGSLTTGNLANVKVLNVEFGKAKIESATGGWVNIKFSSATIGKLVGNVKLNLEFSSATKINIDNSLTGLDAKLSYSSVNLKPTSELSASYDISTSFGDFKNRTNIKFDGDDGEDESKGPKFDHNYNGKSGSGSIPIRIHSSFGKVILGEPNADDMKAKEKNKSKSKTT
jgi:hypothetical protein